MTFNTKTLFAVALSILCSTSRAQEQGSCSIGMTKFVDTPKDFDSILINPTCSGLGFFTTTKLAWTIEPLEEEGAEPAIYSYPPEAVTATLDENVLIFDLNDMGTFPDKAGIVIQVPKWELRDVSIDGVDNHVRVAPGFPNLLSLHSLGSSSKIEADLSESLYSKLIIDASNSVHSIVGEYLNFQMHSVSSKVHIDGSIVGGELDGFANEVLATGRVRDLSVVGNKNMIASGDCESVVVDSVSSSCTIMEEGEWAFDFESIPCTFTACKQKCVSTPYGYCHCTEDDCDGDGNVFTPEEEGVDDKETVETVTDESTSAAPSVATFSVAVSVAALAVLAAF